uniref:non-specific serine/threonine protein kinase n=1 Tax=Macrostomum lignano TaxID=282301 RepID=A0A1I8FKG7_9PLAT
PRKCVKKRNVINRPWPLVRAVLTARASVAAAVQHHNARLRGGTLRPPSTARPLGTGVKLSAQTCGKSKEGLFCDAAKIRGGSREVVAIKCVSKKSLTNTSKENLLKEIELLKTLNHPHIVRLIDFVWDANHIHLILEYCSGGDLLAVYQAAPLPVRLVRRFLQQLALALRYLHSRNVVAHMDLKPQNILLTGGDSPKLKIADFGFAHHLKSDSHADQVRGSLLYMAPEIVGIILYECLFGRAPFASETHEDLLRKIASPDPVSVPAVQCLAGREVPLTAACQDLLTRLLQRDPPSSRGHAAFFGHSFIDLDHAPSAECLEKGKSLALRAVKADSGGELEEAFRLVPAGADLPGARAALRGQRAEERAAPRSVGSAYWLIEAQDSSLIEAR